MANEVINQLAGVAAQIRTARENQPENFQEFFDEWNENFPKSSNFYGTPKNIADMLDKQSAELDDLREKLNAEMCKREEEISQIMTSVNKQLNASCRSAMNERHQASLAQLQQDANHEKSIAAAKAQHDFTESSLSASYDASFMKIQSENAELMHEASKRNTALEAKLVAQQLAHARELESVKKMHQVELDGFANHVSLLEKKLQAMKSSSSAIHDPKNPLVSDRVTNKSDMDRNELSENESRKTDNIRKKV
jgi:uncharacterized coiled-coil protein SlyX